MSSSNPAPLPSVSIVIPTVNNLELLIKCLRSVKALTYPSDKLEVLVVDNASTDGTPDSLGRAFPSVTCLSMETNTGFAPACNAGAARASGDYVAFLNDDAIPDTGWIEALLSGLDAGGEGAVCAASKILSADGEHTEYSGASSNLFGVGRPRPLWGWPDDEEPGRGSNVLFASGGAMLVHRRTFLDVGGFDPEYFAYFEDVDLGWRLWLLGHRVVYAPDAVVSHVGGATGRRSGMHKRQTLWECNSLATVLKNYEGGAMERVFSAGLMLLYKRALLAGGHAINRRDYSLTGPKDTNNANVEVLPRQSVAHLAAIDRFNTLLPHFMEMRRKVQARRTRSDAEILGLLGRLWEPQFAGEEYAWTSRQIANWLDALGLPGQYRPRVLIISSLEHMHEAASAAAHLAEHVRVALVTLSSTRSFQPAGAGSPFTQHNMPADNDGVHDLVNMADSIIAFGVPHAVLRDAGCRIALAGSVPESVPEGAGGYGFVAGGDMEALLTFCLGSKRL
ncbi:MAG TPA: glycosyltransferase family 2 protein [Chloroflexia bacterium]|nr:glycosyltransferase family 2 protein [Chloroflexia bacterium]